MISDTDRLLLSEKLCTKMCHDLSGASMAISNSVEMLNDDTNDDSFKKMAVDIASRGAKGVSARIKFFRVAFGTTGSDLGKEKFDEIIKDYIESISTKAKIVIAEDFEISAIKSRIVFNLLIFIYSLVGAASEARLYKDGDLVCFDIKNQRNFILPKEVEIIGNDFSFTELTPNNSPLFLCEILAKDNQNKISVAVNNDLMMFRVE